jgi:hypothetical protein
MSDEMNKRQQLAALEGWASNKTVSLPERLNTAMQIIRDLRGFLDHCPFEYSGQHYEECPCVLGMPAQ